MGRTLAPEDRISRYRVVGPLGAGGMGEVYVARDESLERSVALKILPPRLVRNEERLRRFVTEAKSASSLNHPNIVTIYEIGQDVVKVGGSEVAGSAGLSDAPSAPVHFISMELISGETLTEKIHHEKADVKTLLGWLCQAAEGISKAHAAGIIHRDLKPGNIMVSRDGFAKVLDFGLAKLTEKQQARGEDLTGTLAETSAGTDEGTIMGTVGYMSPEQVQGKAVDHRSDVFSMGCILYEAVTRKRPFVADTDVEVMHRILRERPAPIEELNSEVPTEIRRLIRRCLTKSPDQRFQSMKDLAIELREIVDEYDTLSAAVPSGGTLISGALGARPAQRRGLVAAIAAGSLLGLGGLVVGLYGILGGRGEGSSSAPSSQQMKISVLMSRSDLGEAVLSGDGRYLAYVTAADERAALHVRQVRTGSDAQILPPQESTIRGISFSPDGDYLYFLSQDPQSPNYHALFQVASLGGTPRKVAFDVDSSVSFSPDGRRICFWRGLLLQNADSLVIAKLESGEERELIRIGDPETFVAPEGSSAAPVWSPDGKRVAVAIFSSKGGAHSRISTIHVESGDQERVGSQTWLFVNSLDWLPDGSAIILSAFVIGSRGNQIYRLSYPDGEVRKMTNDLDGYTGLSLASDGRSVAAVRHVGISNIWVASLKPGSEAQPITFASSSAASVQFIAPLGDGGVAFTAQQGDRGYLWRMETDGSGRRQLTSEGVHVLDVEYTEGSGIVFTQAEEKGDAHLWRVDADGGGLRQITDGPGEGLVTVSPDGRTLLFRKYDAPSALWSMNPAGGEPRLLLLHATGAVIAPDGQRVLASTPEEIEGRLYPRRMVLPLAGGEPVATFLLPPGALVARWTPDGRAVTYIDRDRGFNLMRQSIEGGEPVQLSRFDTGRLINHVWSPDGTRAALHRRLGPQESIWTLSPDGRAPVPVTEFKTGSIWILQWARDSKRLIFTYGTASQDVVLITDFR